MEKKELQIVLNAKDRASKEFRTLSGQLGKTSKHSKELNDDFVKMTGTFKGLGAMRLAKALGGLFILRKIGMLAVDATKQFMDFEAEMRNVNTMMGLSGKAFDTMSTEVLNLSKIVPYTAVELTQGLYKVVSAGISAENQMAFLGVASKFAAAGFTDMDTAVGGLTAVIKGFSLAESDATMVADLFFQANKFGITTIGEMARAMQMMTSAAIKSNMSIQQSMTFLGTFTGITGTASEVATQYRAAVDAIAAPAMRASKYIKDLNKNLGDNKIKFGKGAFEGENFAKISRKIWMAVNQDAEALRRLIPSQEAATLVIAAATSQYDKFNMVLNEMESATGSMQEAFEENMKSSRNQLKLTMNAWGAFKITIGKHLAWIAQQILEFVMGMGETLGMIVKGFSIVAKSIGIVFTLAFKGIVIVFKKFANTIIKGINWLLDKMPGVEPIEIGEIFDVQKTINSLDVVGFMVDDVNDSFGDLKNRFYEFGTSTAEFAKFTETQKMLGKILEDNGEKFTGFGSKAEEANGKAKESFSKLQDGIKKFSESAKKGLEETVEKIKNLKQELQEAISGKETKQRGLRFEYAEAYLTQEKKIADVTKEIKDKENELVREKNEKISGENIKIHNEKLVQIQNELVELKKSLEEEKLIFEERKNLEVRYAEEIRELKRRESLTEFERGLEDLNNKQFNIWQEFEENRKKIEADLELEYDKLEKIQAIQETGLANIQSFLSKQNEMTAESVNVQIGYYNQLASAISSAMQAKRSSQISKMSMPKFDNGGIVPGPTGSPQLAVVHGGETILPTHKKKTGFGNLIININGGTYLSEDVAEKIGDMIIGRLQTNILVG